MQGINSVKQTRLSKEEEEKAPRTQRWCWPARAQSRSPSEPGLMPQTHSAHPLGNPHASWVSSLLKALGRPFRCRVQFLPLALCLWGSHSWSCLFVGGQGHHLHFFFFFQLSLRICGTVQGVEGWGHSSEWLLLYLTADLLVPFVLLPLDTHGINV